MPAMLARPVRPGSAQLAALAMILATAGCTEERDRKPRAPANAASKAEAADEGAKAQGDPAAKEGAVSSKIPIEEVAKYPSPGTSTPSAIRFAPDGKHVTFLLSPDQSLTKQLFSLDLETGKRAQVFAPPEGGATEENLSEEEKLQRERRRERGLGVTRYTWAKDADRLMVPLRGDVWVQDGLDGEPRKVIDTEGSPALDVRFSRDGEHLAFVRDDEVYVTQAAGGAPRQITDGARGTGRTHGLAEYIAQEEMGRHAGYWWSHDAKQIAYTEVDETHIPTWRIPHIGEDAPRWEDHAYPFAGEANAKVKLGVVSAQGGATRWMDLGGEDLYLARVHWMPDGALLGEIENREQTRLDLVRFDLSTGARTTVLTETSDIWINLHGSFRALDKAPGEFLWASESSGYRHLARHDVSGKVVAQLTSGEWMVDGVAAVDEGEEGEPGHVWFWATKDGPTEKHLYRVPLQGGEIVKITDGPGVHGGAVAPKHDLFVDSFSSPSTPPAITIRKLSTGEPVRDVEFAADPRVEQLGLRPPRLVTLKQRDGVELLGAVYEPPAGVGQAPFPTLVSVYGGPHAQRVTKSWGMTADMRAQYYASLGFVVFKLDNRGAARRGLAFEGAIKHDMGNLEVLDQVDGVKWLVEQGLADPTRVGIYGWSYGGYMSAMALARAPGTFQAAVAGAPVTSWDGYDTHYTERYMGTPQSNPEGYERSAVMHHLEGMTGRLMLVHGAIDENVHFRHTARLVRALNRQRKDYELLMFPEARHMPRSEADRVYMEERMRDFFLEALAAAPIQHPG